MVYVTLQEFCIQGCGLSCRQDTVYNFLSRWNGNCLLFRFLHFYAEKVMMTKTRLKICWMGCVVGFVFFFFSIKQSYSPGFFLVCLKINNLLNFFFFFVPRVTGGEFLMEDNGADIQVAAALNHNLRRLSFRAPEKQQYCLQRMPLHSLGLLLASKIANDEGIWL